MSMEAAVRRLEFSGVPFDTSGLGGVLWFIGRADGLGRYWNPHGDEGGVVVAMSSMRPDEGGHPSNVVAPTKAEAMPNATDA
jgi:hypothetical protein